MGARDQYPVGPEDESGGPPDPGELTVLVADDQPVNILLLEMILKARGFRVVTAGGGEEAVRLFHEQHCDLVLMDVMMTGVDGYEAARRIKAMVAERGAFVPVLFVTALSDEKQLAECVACGGDDFITKPINRVQLNAKIDSWLRTQAMHQTLQRQHDVLERHRQRLDMEQRLARRIVARAVAAPVLDADGFHYRYRPAEILSGDLLLADWTPAGRLVVMLGDFTGHGIAAAIGVVPVSNIFRAMVRKGCAPAEMLREINARLCEALPPEMFLAAVTLDMDPASRMATVWNSAMPPVLVLGHDGRVRQRVESSQIPLGVDAGRAPGHEPPAMVRWQAGEALFLCSDGVVEAGEPTAFGQRRLETVLAGPPAGERGGALEAALETHLGHPLPGVDDTTWLELDCDRLFSAGSVAAGNDSGTGPSVATTAAGAWTCQLCLEAPMLQRVNPVPLMLDTVDRLAGPLQQRQSLYLVLAELYANALEHGLLRLDSSLKQSGEGFARYYQLREQALNALDAGEIRIRIHGAGSRLHIRVEDSGPGFAHQALAERLSAGPGTAALPAAGRGLHLVNALCEHLAWEGAGNRVQALFRL